MKRWGRGQNFIKNDKIISMEIIRNFEEISKNDSALAGGKGASLGEMTQASIPVPPGFVVLSAAFDQFLHETDLTQEIDAILEKVDHKEIHTVEDASEKIHGLIKNAVMPEDIASEIIQEFKNLNTEFIAVRSSATSEDGAENAWAGQLDSFLNTTEENLLEKIQYCWASLFTPRAIFYRFEKGLHTTKISVAVIVQKMIQSEVSGIAFSVHPITENPNQLIIEAGFGLGEAVVSGSVTPDSYVVEKESKEIIDKNIQKETQCLTDNQILELSGLILKIENHFGFPVDVEWTFQNGEFYIVQSRPITTLKEPRKDTEKFISYENPIYPYFYSSVTEAPKRKYEDKYLMGGWFIKFRYGTTAIVDAPESSFKEYGNYFLGLLLDKDSKFENYIFDLAKKLIDLNKKLEERNHTDLKNGTVSDIKDFYEEFNEIYSVAIGIGYSLDYALDKYIKNEEIDIHKIEKKYYSFAQKEKHELQQIFKDSENLEEELTEHALRYSWLQNDYSGEYRLTVKDFMARKEKILEEQIDYVDIKLQRPSSILEWADFLTMIRDERKKSNLIVDGLLDRYLSAECEKYKIPREVAVMSTIMEFEQNKKRKLNDYKGVRTAEVTHNSLIDISNEEWKTAVKDTLVYDHSKTIKGVSAMPGKVIGNVKIVLSRNDFHKLNDGDILVTSMTRPEFTLILSKISAIITNEGGITCHAAIVARELKKPCIIGTKTATKILKDGDKVEVDADLGIIRIIEN